VVTEGFEPSKLGCLSRSDSAPHLTAALPVCIRYRHGWPFFFFRRHPPSCPYPESLASVPEIHASLWTDPNGIVGVRRSKFVHPFVYPPYGPDFTSSFWPSLSGSQSGFGHRSSASQPRFYWIL